MILSEKKPASRRVFLGSLAYGHVVPVGLKIALHVNAVSAFTDITLLVEVHSGSPVQRQNDAVPDGVALSVTVEP